MRRLTKAGRALRGRRCSTDPNEQAPTPVRTSSLYRATRQGWGPSGQPPSWLLQAHSPGRSWPLSRPERHGCHSTSQSTPTTEVTARAQIARARLGLVTKRCLEVPPECMQGGSLWPGRALERQRSAAHDPCCAGGWGSRLSGQHLWSLTVVRADGDVRSGGRRSERLIKTIKTLRDTRDTRPDSHVLRDCLQKRFSP